MKKSFWILLIPVLAIGALIYYLLYGKKPGATSGVQSTTSSQTGIRQWFPGWNGFTATSINNQGAALSSAENLLTNVSNAFGISDGGNNPGVSSGGSSAGGTQSSGSGAGVPTSLSDSNIDIWDTSFNNSDYAPAPLNNYDVLNTTQSAASVNTVDTGITSGDSGNPFGGEYSDVSNFS